MIIKDSEKIIDPKFVDVPFVYEGKTLDGTDCIGLTILFLKEHGFDYEYDPKAEPALHHWYLSSMQKFADAMFKYGKVLGFSELKKFDVVMFFGNDGLDRFPVLMGIVIDEGRHFLMNFREHGSHVVMFDEEWKSKFFGGMRLYKVMEKD